MSRCLEGKVAIVTGSGQGIGQGIAIGLARLGAKVITNNRKPNGESAQKYRKEDMPAEDWEEFLRLKGDAQVTADKILAEGGEAIPFFGDCSKWDVAESIIKKAMDTWGRIDIIVNNAAGMGTGSIATMDEANWDLFMESRSKSAVALMHYAFPFMKEQGYGRIINVASDAWTGLAGNDGYSASTASLVGLTWAAAKELDQFGITVNCICPQGASPAHAVEYNALIRQITAAGHAPDPKVLKVVEADHGDPVNLAPFIAVLCVEDYINGSIFSIKSSGRFQAYTQPELGRMITNGEKGPWWDVEELKVAIKEEMLGPDYKAPGKAYGWGR
ncbi:MAG: SDR family NAD(P)-dependent oxidoreductase [Dorea sp.]|nr:SDR family NAD(P)-dependent oxidoreductase [Dorea sp.]